VRDRIIDGPRNEGVVVGVGGVGTRVGIDGGWRCRAIEREGSDDDVRGFERDGLRGNDDLQQPDCELDHILQVRYIVIVVVIVIRSR